jgi:hypothetical protein
VGGEKGTVAYRQRLSLRRIQIIFREWQWAAGFVSLYNFHALRHTAITNVYRATNADTTRSSSIAWGGWKSSPRTLL